MCDTGCGLPWQCQKDDSCVSIHQGEIKSHISEFHIQPFKIQQIFNFQLSENKPIQIQFSTEQEQEEAKDKYGMCAMAGACHVEPIATGLVLKV